MSPLAGALAIVTAVAAGVVAGPFTLWLALFVMAWLPRPRVALVLAALWMVPLFRVKAVAATLMPFASTSLAATAYSKVSVLVPVPLA